MCITKTAFLLFPLEHVPCIWFTYGHPVTMEGNGLGLCQAHNTITLKQHHISCRAKSKKTSEKCYLMVVLKVLGTQWDTKLIDSNPSSPLDNHNWKKMKHWSKWWCQLNHLAMFTRAFKEMEDKEWEQGPCTTNPVEAFNRQSLQDG